MPDQIHPIKDETGTGDIILYIKTISGYRNLHHSDHRQDPGDGPRTIGTAKQTTPGHSRALCRRKKTCCLI